MDAHVDQLLQKCRQHSESGEVAAALDAAQRALAAAQNDKDRCSALALLAYLNVRLGDYSAGERLATEVLNCDMYAPQRAMALLTLGNCASYANDLARAEALYHQAADLSRRLGDLLNQAQVLHALAATVYCLRGQFDLALAASAEAQHLYTQGGEPGWGNPMIRAEILRMVGDRQGARQALDELKAATEPGSLYRGIYFCYQARLALDEDDVAAAETWLPQARQIAEAVGSPILNVWMRVEQSRCARIRGATGAARAWAEDAVGFSRRSGFRYIEVLAQIEYAQTLWSAGDLDAVQREMEAARTVAQEYDLRYETARVTFYLAALAHQREAADAEMRWIDATAQIERGGYAFLLERERKLAFPLIAAHLSSENQQARSAAEALLDPLTRMAPLPLHVLGLGRFRVHQGRHPLPDRNWQRRRAGDLFRYLLLQPGHTALREALIEALWPDQSPDTASSSFHQATSALRRLLESDLPTRFPSRYLSVENERIALRLPPGSTVDFETFEQQVQVALATAETKPLAATLALYVDDLFPQDRYADWAEPARERLAQLYLRGLLALAERHLAAKRPHQALACCRDILERDSWREDAVLVGMRAHLVLNDRPAALHLYINLQETLRQELGLDPRSDLQALVASIRGAE